MSTILVSLDPEASAGALSGLGLQNVFSYDFEERIRASESAAKLHQEPITPQEEQRLVARARRGDKGAFGQLVAVYRERLYRTAELHVGVEDARDLSQDAFVKAYKNLHKFEEGRPFFPWLRRIVINLSKNHLNKSSTRRNVSLDCLMEENHEQFPASDLPIPEKLYKQQMAIGVRQAVEKLPAKYRQIIAMYHFEDMSYQEIATSLGIPIGTVMSRLSNARKLLVPLLKNFSE